MSTVPANNAVNVAVSSTVGVTFSESVFAGPVAFSISCAGNPQAFSTSGGPATTYTLTPSSPLPSNSSCTVSVTAAQISDADSNDPPDTMASNVSFSFSTPPAGAGKVMINEVDADGGATGGAGAKLPAVC